MQLWLSGNDELIGSRDDSSSPASCVRLPCSDSLNPLADLLLEDVAAIGRLAGLRIDAREDILKNGFLEPEELARSGGRASTGCPALPMENISFWPPLSTSTRSNTSSRSSDSPGTCWKYQASLPLSGLSATVELVNNALSPGFGAAADAHPRLGLSDSPVCHVEIGIVTARDPGFASCPHQVRNRAPRIGSRLIRRAARCGTSRAACRLPHRMR